MTIDEYAEAISALSARDGFTARDRAGLLAACQEALRSDVRIARVGCAVMCHGTVVSVGRNAMRTDPTQRRWNRFRTFEYLTDSDPANMDSIHAEIAAIKAIPWPVDKQMKWGQARVYVFRVAPGLPLGQGMARPCPACWNALLEKGVRQVVYTTGKGFAKEHVAGG